ncbi:MAG: YjfB family protein [bacterium]
MDVRISNDNAIEALKSMLKAGDIKTQTTGNVLKKTLDTQEQAATQLLKMISGKGQIIDIRV